MSGNSWIVPSRVIAGPDRLSPDFPSANLPFYACHSPWRGRTCRRRGCAGRFGTCRTLARSSLRGRHAADGERRTRAERRTLATSPRPDFPARCTLKYSTALRRKLCPRCSARREASRRTRASKLPFETTARSRLQSESNASPRRHERNRASLREAGKLGAGSP